MDMSGQQHIPASKEEVWNALNDPEVLKVCIPGCQELTKSSDTEMSAVAVIKVGPVKAQFQGAVTLSELDPPNGYKITGEGQGGVAGFAKGLATVRLEATDDGTILHYNVDAQIGGKLSQLGARLIDVTAKQLSGQFFKRFAEEIERRQNPVQVESGIEQASGKSASAQERSPSQTVSSSSRTWAPPMSNSSSTGMLVGLPMIAAVVFVSVLAAMWVAQGGLVPGLGSAPGNMAHDGQAWVSKDLSTVVQIIMAAAVGYLFGTRATSRG
ncbi:carbon monoxide dehydrogenase subunit G [Pararhizobium sp. LjRoot255]|uniref:CoxG family protein n=1 Tax=Pararhizobium sp. LjRoot255 TaxID=3342298 RepID=UPI003ED0076E